MYFDRSRDKLVPMSFTLGIDYGTNSVRAIVVDCSDGREVGSSVVNYPTGRHGVLLEPRDHHVARQHPGDYFFGLRNSVSGAMEQASKDPSFSVADVIGIGVDTTGSSPLPVDAFFFPSRRRHTRFKCDWSSDVCSSD